MKSCGTGLKLAVMTGVLILGLLSFDAGCAETLKYGMKGEEVARLQQALCDLALLNGKVDGIYGRKTEDAVRAFQKKNRLTVDGMAGKQTQQLLFTEKKQDASSLFSGDYTTIREDSDKSRVKALQKALISLNYLKGEADGEYGSLTRTAVLSFQKVNQLQADGLAGKKTLKAVESAAAEGRKAPDPEKETEIPEDAGKMTAPDRDDILLLSWYEEVRPKLRSNAKLTVYEPVSGLGWKMKVISKDRHCDCEPLTLTDTQIMLKAFSGKHTWNQKGVYVLLPDGRWTVGTTHSMPHLKGYIKNNGFDGRTCVHFFRNLEECAEKDPNYGVSNQRTIRTLWKKVSGETVN